MEKAPSAQTSASRIFITALAAASACAAPNAQVRRTPEPEEKAANNAQNEQADKLHALLSGEIAAMREATQRLTAALAALESRNLEKGICGGPDAADEPYIVDRSDDRPSLESLKQLQKIIQRNLTISLREEPPYTACDDIRRAIADTVFMLGGRSHGKPKTPCPECPEYFRFQPDNCNLVEWHIFGNPSSASARAFHVWTGRTTGPTNDVVDITAPDLMINGRCSGRTLTDDM